MSATSRRKFLRQTGLFITAGFVSPALWEKKIGQELLPPAQTSTRFAGPNQAVLFPAAPFQLQTPHHALLMDLDPTTYQARFDQLGKQGYRSIWFQGSSNGDGNGYGSQPATFSGIFVRDGFTGGWYQYVGLTAADYQTRFTDFANQGYKPISVSGYMDNGSNVYGAIWITSSDGYMGIHGATSDAYQAFVDSNISAGLRPEVVDGYPVGLPPGAAADYISIWDNNNTLPWVARHGLTSADYQAEFDNWLSQGYRVYSVSAYAINGTPYFAALWVKDGLPDWYGRHNFLGASMFSDAVTGAQHDYQPIVIEPYNTGNDRHFAGVWIKKARAWSASGSANPDLVSFDNTVQNFMLARNIPSAQLAVTKDSRLVYARGYRWDYDNVDPVQPDSLFRIASVTKPITSTGIMLLVQQGKLNLTDKLVNLITLPTPADTRVNNITVQNLLQHQGGWNRDTTFDPMLSDVRIATGLGKSLPVSQQDIIAYMMSRSLDFNPGTAVNYSNFGYLLLGRIIEAVSQQRYADFIRDNVLTPLKMSKTILGASELEYRQPGEVAYYVSNPRLSVNVRQPGGPENVMDPYGGFNLENMDSHGGWLSTAVDLMRFAAIFDATGGYPLLTKDNIDKIFAQPATGASSDGSWYAFGWAVRPAGTGMNTWHNGSLPGTSTLLVRRFDGLNWVILFNQRDDVSDPNGSTYGQIDAQLHNAANAVTNWPTGDLFPNF